MTSIGQSLRRERRLRRQRQADAADWFGISQPSYHRWESEENCPAESRFGRVAEYLGLTIEEVWMQVNDEPQRSAQVGHGNNPPQRLDHIDREITLLRDEVAAAYGIVAEVRRQQDQMQRELSQLKAYRTVLA